jgi:cyclopropane fatty-acyl-phospholipid synthase-like methyltransferase
VKAPVQTLRIASDVRVRPHHTKRDDVIRYYEIAGPDYAAWSPKYNMHFGLFDRWMNPFRREEMLDRMNQATLDRLHLLRGRPAALADMGCGLGATARYIAGQNPDASVRGFTIVPWQVATGNRMTVEQGLERRVRLVLADYVRTPAPRASVDAAYAIESASYASGPDKSDLVAEMARIVRPGGRVSFSDGFRKDSEPLRSVLGAVYRVACRSWAIREMAVIDRFVGSLEAHGFVDVRVEELSWRVAPSFAHVPLLCLRFALERFLKGEFAWPKERWQNLIGPLFGCLLGLHRSRFGYFMVSATRGADLDFHR